MSITFPPHGAANTQTSASRRSNAQASRVEMRPAKRRYYVKKRPKKIQSPPKMFLKVDMILRLQQHLMKLFPPPPRIQRLKRNHALTHVRISRWFPTSSGRLSGLVPFPAPGLSRSMSGDWKFCTAASSSLEQLAVTKTSKGPSIKNHVRKPLEFAMFLPTYLPTKIWNDPNNEKNELLIH